MLRLTGSPRCPYSLPPQADRKKPLPRRRAPQGKDHGCACAWPACLLAALIGLSFDQARAQSHSGPPAVGVVRAEMRPITETSEFVGRIQSMDRVALVARVTAFLEQRLFTEGAEVNKGDLLYVLEQPPFQADLAAKQATVQQCRPAGERDDRLQPRRVAAAHAGRPAIHRG